MNKKIEVRDLKKGMYVEVLDRPWIETPYLIQGILIQSNDDITELAQYCKYVYISTDEKEAPAVKKKCPADHYKFHVIPEDTGKKSPFHGQSVYVDAATMEEELPIAKQAHEKAIVLMDQIKVGIDRNLTLDIKAARQLVTVIASSMIRNPEAMLFLNDISGTKLGNYNHAINTATNLIAFGRHLCLPTDELTVLGLGGLLMDIGQLKLERKEVMKKGGLFTKEMTMMDEHVTYGESILSHMPGIPTKVIEITAQHHEREDGSGYPRGLSGNQITPYARMAAIVDSYERMISQGVTPDYPPSTPFESLKMLWDWSRKWLNATLVQQFAHCIGLFPVGSLIELNTHEVAIVLTHNRTKRLSPRVMIVLDPNKKPYATPWILDLAIPSRSLNGVPYEIIQDLDRGAYGINPKDYYI